MKINRLTQYSVLAHGPSKFNTANFKTDNTYFIMVVPICTNPVFLILWTTDSRQPGKVIKQPQYKFRLVKYYVVQMFRWSTCRNEAAECFETSVHFHQTPRCQSQEDSKLHSRLCEKLKSKKIVILAVQTLKKNKFSVNYHKLQKIFKSIYQFVLAGLMFVSE